MGNSTTITRGSLPKDDGYDPAEKRQHQTARMRTKEEETGQRTRSIDDGASRPASILNRVSYLFRVEHVGDLIDDQARLDILIFLE